jgi:hypothetical protein
VAESTAVGYGCLIAIDGTDSHEIATLATGLRDTLVERKLATLISRWDASALFTDFAAAPVQHRDVSPRTLMLLYAADLAFRARWEILPAIAAGQIVIAAPYVTTAVAFGVASGVSQDWLATLFRFSPTPARTVLMREPRNAVWKRRPEVGFGECCTALLKATPEGFKRRKTRAMMATAISTAAESHGGLYHRRERRTLVEEIVKLHDRRARRARNPRRAQ